jgi:predicted phosphodiesterase
MIRRVALLSDVHGNLAALDKVLADIASCGCGETYCLGDLVGYGPDPSGVVERMRERAIPTIRGNYDDGVGKRLGNCGCFYDSEQARTDGTASYVFTDKTLNADDHAWLAALPDNVRLEAAGLRVLLTHGSPRKINEYLMPERPSAQLARLADNAEADVVCVGHVHMPYHRVVTADDGRRVHYVNAGSVGKPKDGDPRACWVELLLVPPDEADVPFADEIEAAGADRALVGTIVHRVNYDVDAVAARMVAVGLPQRLAAQLKQA